MNVTPEKLGTLLILASLYMLFGGGISSVHADTAPEVVADCNKHRTDETMCMACNIYHEARGEKALGMLGVALVTNNRGQAKRFPASVCEVVWEKHKHYKTGRVTPQFSWTLDGKHDRVYNRDVWEHALKIATRITEGTGYKDITAGALWYHADYVSPPWASSLYPTIHIGDHQFYAADEATAYAIMEANFDKIEE